MFTAQSKWGGQVQTEEWSQGNIPLFTIARSSNSLNCLAQDQVYSTLQWAVTAVSNSNDSWDGLWPQWRKVVMMYPSAPVTKHDSTHACTHTHTRTHTETRHLSTNLKVCIILVPSWVFIFLLYVDFKTQHREEIIIGVNTEPLRRAVVWKSSIQKEKKGQTITLYKNIRAYLPTLSCEYERGLGC